MRAAMGGQVVTADESTAIAAAATATIAHLQRTRRMIERVGTRSDLDWLDAAADALIRVRTTVIARQEVGR